MNKEITTKCVIQWRKVPQDQDASSQGALWRLLWGGLKNGKVWLTLGLDQRKRGLNPKKCTGQDPAKTELDHLKAFRAAAWLCLHSHHLAQGSVQQGLSLCKVSAGACVWIEFFVRTPEGSYGRVPWNIHHKQSRRGQKKKKKKTKRKVDFDDPKIIL